MMMRKFFYISKLDEFGNKNSILYRFEFDSKYYYYSKFIDLYMYLHTKDFKQIYTVIKDYYETKKYNI